jgi:hypothetical protein
MRGRAGDNYGVRLESEWKDVPGLATGHHKTWD